MPGVYEQVRYILITFLCETLQMSNISTAQGYYFWLMFLEALEILFLAYYTPPVSKIWPGGSDIHIYELMTLSICPSVYMSVQSCPVHISYGGTLEVPT